MKTSRPRTRAPKYMAKLLPALFKNELEKIYYRKAEDLKPFQLPCHWSRSFCLPG